MKGTAVVRIGELLMSCVSGSLLGRRLLCIAAQGC
jgi:hypothetical protein